MAALLAVGTAALAPMAAMAAQLDNDARSVIPKNVQQIIVVDYRAMQNSQAAMDLKARVLPPPLKQLEEAMKNSGFNENHDVEELAFAAFRVSEQDTKTIGIAQGQFDLPDIMATLKKNKIKPQVVRDNKLYPMGKSGMLVVFLNPTTMVFGSSDSLKLAMDVRDGLAPSLLTNSSMLQQMTSVDTEPLWSIMDDQGTQFMMHGLLGEASQLTDYNSIKKRLLGSRYTMNFQNGVKFNLVVSTPDTFTAATMSSLLNAAAMYKKVSGTAVEKSAIDDTTIDSSAGDLEVSFAASDSQFSTLLQSPLFHSVVQ
ncbi:hypothetical protein [Silvibacterium dinghuense]|uniref:DUF2066 domain-containing protein n=1 Tax=Silvibacterium dinghuense TaxID=1560006 RepID=A0A4Q1SDU5_9BACT|nr:hypothetical protein [Silvibacterium dinghuense]RXS95416.1 hypothetical protein ESZ00_12625 [Silvibacterium dinghuense]